MKKIITLGTTAIMGLTSLGITPFVVHADTAKSGDTVVSYKGQAQPQPWALSVPATVNLNQKQTATLPNGMSSEVITGNGTVAITSEDGTSPFKDPSENRFFLVSATSKNNNWLLKSADGKQFSDLYVKSSLDPVYQIPSNTYSLAFKSMTNGTDSVLSAKVSFAAPYGPSSSFIYSNLDPTVSYSDIITWTAKETTSQQMDGTARLRPHG